MLMPLMLTLDLMLISKSHRKKKKLFKAFASCFSNANQNLNNYVVKFSGENFQRHYLKCYGIYTERKIVIVSVINL